MLTADPTAFWRPAPCRRRRARRNCPAILWFRQGGNQAAWRSDSLGSASAPALKTRFRIGKRDSRSPNGGNTLTAAPHRRSDESRQGGPAAVRLRSGHVQVISPVKMGTAVAEFSLLKTRRGGTSFFTNCRRVPLAQSPPRPHPNFESSPPVLASQPASENFGNSGARIFWDVAALRWIPHNSPSVPGSGIAGKNRRERERPNQFAIIAD